MSARTQLVEVLSSLMGYNDKGFEWSGHTPEETDQHREKARVEIAALIEQIGETKWPATFIEAFKWSSPEKVDAASAAIGWLV